MFIGYLVVGYLTLWYAVGFVVGFAWDYPVIGSLTGLLVGIFTIVQQMGSDPSEEI